MFTKSFTILVFAVATCLVQPNEIAVEILPFVDSSLPITFKKIISEPAPKLPSNLASYTYAIDFSVPASLAQLQCVKQSGYGAVFIRAYNPVGEGSLDTNAYDSIQNAYSAGLGVEIYMTPQPSSTKVGYEQFDEIYQGLTSKGITVRSIWIQVTSPTNWPSTATSNVKFINNIVSRARDYNLTVGIYTSYYDWNLITHACTSIGDDVLLWYWHVLGSGVNAETPANFDDFRPFGSWNTPAIKQFGHVETVCGLVVVNRNVYAAG